MVFDFDHWVSILNSLYENNFSLTNDRHNSNTMVFSEEQQETRNQAYARIQALRSANLVRVSGRGVVRVVRRVDDARENNNLDLSDCQLIQVPDAIYLMMRDTQLTACNLSSNVITKIPPKFPTNFNFITDLNLSFNKMSSLPEEISQCTELETVDISHNSFINLPNCLLNLPNIIQINAKKNFIADVEVEVLSTCGSLETLNLEENPLSRECQDKLSSVTSVRIKFTPRELEEWEDLSI